MEYLNEMGKDARLKLARKLVDVYVSTIEETIGRGYRVPTDSDSEISVSGLRIFVYASLGLDKSNLVEGE